jgi:predicted permease
MSGVLAVVAPVFGIVLLGFAAVRMGWFDAGSTRGLVRFVFYFAIPALLLRSLVAMQLPDSVPWGFLLSYYGGSLVIFALGMLAARLLFDRPPDHRAIFGMSAGFSNTVLVGLPVLLTALGPEATLPVFLLIALQSPILMPLTVALIQVGKGDTVALGPRLRAAWSDLMRTPIVTSVLAGLALNLAGLALPGPLEVGLAMLGAAAVPCALFAMGASLAGFPLRGDLSAASLLVFLKLAVHPLVVWALAVLLFGLEGVWVAVAVGMAAMPSGINAYLFAARYEAAEGVAARTVFLSTAASVVTIAVVLALLD